MLLDFCISDCHKLLGPMHMCKLTSLTLHWEKMFTVKIKKETNPGCLNFKMKCICALEKRRVIIWLWKKIPLGVSFWYLTHQKPKTNKIFSPWIIYTKHGADEGCSGLAHTLGIQWETSQFRNNHLSFPTQMMERRCQFIHHKTQI